MTPTPNLYGPAFSGDQPVLPDRPAVTAGPPDVAFHVDPIRNRTAITRGGEIALTATEVTTGNGAVLELWMSRGLLLTPALARKLAGHLSAWAESVEPAAKRAAGRS